MIFLQGHTLKNVSRRIRVTLLYRVRGAISVTRRRRERSEAHRLQHPEFRQKLKHPLF